jgi:hypothetical protein
VAPVEPEGSVGAAFCLPAHTAELLQRMLTIIKGPMIVLPSNLPWLSSLALAGFLLCGGAPAQAQQFSADLVITRGDGAAAPAGKLRVSSDKVRIETPELADGFFLIDGARPAAFFVRPAAGTFMEARQSSRLTRIFVQVDPEDPCLKWQAMARVAGVADQEDWRCEHVGEETIDGHRAIVYRAVSPTGRELFGWIDSVRKFPLRIKTEDGATVTAQNLRDEPQPAQLFEVPPGFRKFDPQILIQQIKQSDVWVGGEEDLDPSHR